MERGMFMYSGDPVSVIAQQEHRDFYLFLKKAVLDDLRAKNLLTDLEYACCTEMIEESQRVENA